LRSRNNWLRGHFSEAFNDTLTALKILGIELNPTLTRRQVDALFEQVKNEILAVGFDTILSIPRTTDGKTELAVALLNDAGQHERFHSKITTDCNFYPGINSYWGLSRYALTDIIGLTVCLSSS